MQSRVVKAVNLTTAASNIAAEGTGAPVRSRRMASHLRAIIAAVTANRGARIGLILVVALVGIALFAPLTAPHDPDQMSAGMALLQPDGDQWFGTDEFGRDIFNRVVYGARLTIKVGVIAVGISLTIGTLNGWSRAVPAAGPSAC